MSNHIFYVASRPFAQRRGDVVEITLERIRKLPEWSAQNRKEVATFLASQLGLELEITQLATDRYSFGVAPISDRVVAEQQKIADVFAELKLIPHRINVREAVWLPRR